MVFINIVYNGLLFILFFLKIMVVRLYFDIFLIISDWFFNSRFFEYVIGSYV